MQSNAFLPNGYLKLNYKSVSILSISVVISILFALWGGYQYAYWQLAHNQDSLIGEWQQYLHKDRKWLKEIELQTQQHIQVMTQHLGQVEANLVKLNVLGERLVEQAHLNPQEFNFDPAAFPNAYPIDKTDLLVLIRALDPELEKRYIQLHVVHDALQARLSQQQLALTGHGKPVLNGVVSSFFGTRADPMTGHRAWHAGVDIAGKEGSQVRAVATGVVSFAAEKGGYGRTVEIHHGNGLATRYGHNKAVLVQPGQLVKKGQTIALLGNTGRSTGPHLHLEVHKNGIAVDPGHYFTDLRRR